MTANPQTDAQPKSRRALLAGALGGVGAWAASMVGRATPTAAGEGDPIIIGKTNYGRGTHTQLQTKSNGSALTVTQLSGSHAIRGEATSGRAVVGVAGADGTGVWAYSPDHYGVNAKSPKGTAILATGNLGMDVGGSFLSARFQTGVRFQSFLDIQHRTVEPEAPNPGRTRLFVRLNESSKQEVCVKFPGGAVAVLATEP